MCGRFTRGDGRYVVGAVSGAHFLSHLYLLAYPPLFPLLANEFAVTTTQLGLLITAIYGPTLVLQLPLGETVDRIGAKRVLVGGIVLTSLAITVSGLATAYWMLLVCAAISGIGQSVFHPADYALLDAVTTPETEGKAFGAHTFGGFVGFAAAPVIVGGIGIAYGWQLALLTVGSAGFVFAAAFALTTAPVHATKIRTSDPEPTSSLRETARELLSFAGRADILGVFVFYLLSMMAIVGLQSFTTVLAIDTYGFDESLANTLLTAHLASTAVGVILGGPLADRLPFHKVLIATFLLAAVVIWIAAVGVADAGFVGPLMALSLAGILLGLALPSRDTFANSIADPGAAGKSFGFFFTGLSLGAMVSPALLGAVIDGWSATVGFLLVGGFLLAAVTVIIVRPTGHRTERRAKTL